VKFLEDKGLIQRNLLGILWDEYSKVRTQIPLGFYKTYLAPLFYSVLNTPVSSRSDNLPRHYLGIPYLNGGLFRKSIPNEHNYDVEDDIMERIVKEFLEKYSFTLSGEGGLDPDILGNVFEKTINYISKVGTEAQKAKGAYYTPDDVVSFITKRTLHPHLLERIVIGLRDGGWTDSDLRKYQTLESFLENPPRTKGDIERAIEIVEGVTVLDPACGSGHFLTGALKELVFVKESLLKAVGVQYSLYDVKRQIISSNLFGVDIEGSAIEIAKLRLWLSLIEDLDIAEKGQIEALPNIEYNIMQGNSLIGWVGEDVPQKTLFRPYDSEDVQSILNELELAYSSDPLKLQIVSKASDDFNSYDIHRILDGYASLREIYPLEPMETSGKLGALLGEIRQSVWEFITGAFAQSLSPNKKRKGKRRKDVALDRIRDERPFHWGMDFHNLLDSGFSVTIGNPPYIEVAKKKRTLLKNYRTESCGNTHAFFFERAFSLLGGSGFCGLIVPISSVSTDRMALLQEMLMEECSTLWIANFDDRPGKIFPDLEHCRSSIIIGRRKDDGGKCKVNTTRYNRWYTKDRKDIFRQLQFVDATQFITSGSIPKIGEEMEKVILDKIVTNKPLSEFLGDLKGILWYHNAPQYWIRALDFIPYFWNEKEGEKVSSHMVEICTKIQYVKTLTAVLNSSLFYWYFVTHSNGRDLTNREIHRFPLSLDKLPARTRTKLNKESDNLMKDYKKNAKRKTCRYRTTGQVKYDEFFPGKSKHIIDRIDDILANHYGLTSSEAAYIKAFDIKFRLGEVG
jgi:hypothetical protein